MNTEIDSAVESLSLEALDQINLRGIHALWLHSDVLDGQGRLLELVARATPTPDLQCVFCSGNMSELVHDAFDDLLELEYGSDVDVLTVWSDDDFSEAAWEFMNVYGHGPKITKIKILFVAASNSTRMQHLLQLSSMALGNTDMSSAASDNDVAS